MNFLFCILFFLAGPELLYLMQQISLTTHQHLSPGLCSVSDTLATSSCTRPQMHLAPPTLLFSPAGPHPPPLASPALRQWEEQGELLLPLTFLLLVLGSLLLYLAVSLMDPGYVNVQPQPQVTRGPWGPEPLLLPTWDPRTSDGLIPDSV